MATVESVRDQLLDALGELDHATFLRFMLATQEEFHLTNPGKSAIAALTQAELVLSDLEDDDAE